MKYGVWSPNEVETLQDLIADGYTQLAASKVMNRSENSVTAKLAAIRCKTNMANKGPPGVQFAASFDIPTPRRNDCTKHLTMILKAHRAGFPVCGGTR